jgi:adenylate cyclase
MNGSWQIKVYDRQQLVYSGESTGIVELGRQTDDSEQAYSQEQESGCLRIVIAQLNEDSVSRRHALLEPLPDGRVRVKNVSAKLPIGLPDGGRLKIRESCEVCLPTLLTFGNKTVRIQGADEGEPEQLQVLAEATHAPGQVAGASFKLPSFALPSAAEMDVEALVRWLREAMDVLHSAAASSDFFSRAAEAVVNMVGMDSGRVLLCEEGNWKVEAMRTAPHLERASDWPPSRQVLNRVRQEKRTFWKTPGHNDLQAVEGVSLVGMAAVVAAPILDRHGQVIGALYGDRRLNSRSVCPPHVTKLEAILVELLASGVAAGLARIEQEQAAVAARVQFEKFFTPELARELAVNPDLLKGRDCEVTLLFCDIRGFSRISERLSPAETVEWVSNVMETLSDCVLAHRGVLVDYIGDEIMAMWGAPEKQADHARMACRAALDMIAALPQLNERWQPLLSEPTNLGIGINSGPARVGNTGSERKFKYGPLGNTVNLASRVQGATKYLKARLLVTGATQGQLDASFPSRRLCKVAVVNIAEPVDLYELVPPGQEGWAALQSGYEQALEGFETKEFRKTARILGNLIMQFPEDGPTLVLMSRAVNSIVDESAFEPVWKLPGK